MGKTRIRVLLTGIGSVLTESAEKKLKIETDGIPRCSGGYTREWYEDMNIKEENIPQDLKDKEKALDQDIELLDEDFEEIYSSIMVYEDEIKLIVQDEDETTTIFLKDGLTISVLESVDQIYDYLAYMEISWLKKRYNLFLNFFR